MNDRDLPRDTIEAMVARVGPEWRVREAALANSGYLPVYHLSLGTPSGDRECVLKAAPDDTGHGVALEGRLLAGLDERTDVPVPAVVGAVDRHDAAPGPYFLMESVAGTAVPRSEMDRLDPATFERIARQVGAHLASVHELDAVDAYGFLTVDPNPPLSGERPRGDFGEVAVVDPESSWPTRAGEWAEAALGRLAETRFDDLTDDVAPVLGERVDALEGPFRPVLSHVDGAIENLLLDGDRDVVAMVDWAFTLAVPPAYDLVFVEQSLAGGHRSHVPDAPDVRAAVRRGLVEGYGTRGRDGVLERFRRHHDCYDLLAVLQAMVTFDEWFESRNLDADVVDGAAANHRRACRELL